MTNFLQSTLFRRLVPFLGFAFALALGLALAAAAGEDPIHILNVIFKSAFGSRYDFGVTLYYTTPLIFTGISVAIAFQAGLFNIGAEGQLNLGAFAIAVLGLALPNLSWPLALLASLATAATAGGFWGWLAGFLKARFGSHEVISTIMLNFLSAAITSWLVTSFFQNPEIQSPETRPLSTNYFMHAQDPLALWFADAPVSVAIVLAIIWAIGFWIFLCFTTVGYELRATGLNPEAARHAGIDTKKIQRLAMLLAGISAGLVGIGEVLGFAGKYRLGFSADFGFMGIAVALLARAHPLGVIMSAFGFAVLHKGAADLDIETDFITRDLSVVIQGLVILLVSVGLGLTRSRQGEK